MLRAGLGKGRGRFECGLRCLDRCSTCFGRAGKIENEVRRERKKKDKIVVCAGCCCVLGVGCTWKVALLGRVREKGVGKRYAGVKSKLGLVGTDVRRSVMGCFGPCSTLLN